MRTSLTSLPQGDAVHHRADVVDLAEPREETTLLSPTAKVTEFMPFYSHIGSKNAENLINVADPQL